MTDSRLNNPDSYRNHENSISPRFVIGDINEKKDSTDEWSIPHS